MKKSGYKSKYNRIQLIINPASGKNEPILNVVNDVFRVYPDIDWQIDITKKFGDAEEFTKKAIENKVDLVVVYGGDGTLHEVINAAVGTEMTIGILPGGTGNGFASGLFIPRNLRKALEIIPNGKTKKVDIAKVNDKYCISRMYTGIEEDVQTSRELKDKYGMFAYAINTFQTAKTVPIVDYEIEIDGKLISEQAVKVYVANSASTGMKINIGNFDVTDGLLDVFTIGKDFGSMISAVERIWHSNDTKETLHHWKGKKIVIKPKEDQPVWIDGEHEGRTPITVEVIPGAIEVIVP